MAKMKEIICACGCGRKKMVRVADIKRGWGKYYSKSCKAKHQERKTGQYKNYLCNRINGQMNTKKQIETLNGMDVPDGYGGLTDQDFDECMAECEVGWEGHKNVW